MENILASSTSPLHIRSVILEISFGVRLDQYRWKDVTTSSILALDKWLSIDRILASPKFVELHTVEIRVNGEFTVMSPWFSGTEISLGLGEIDFSTLLPTLSSHPRILLITSHNNDLH